MPYIVILNEDEMGGIEMKKTLALIIVVLVMAFTLSGCISIEFSNREKVSEFGEIKGEPFSGENISIVNRNGSIEIIPRDENNVEIHFEKRVSGPRSTTELESILDLIEIVVEEINGNLTIKLITPNNLNNLSIGANMKVYIPKNVSIQANSSNGNIELGKGLSGDIDFNSSNGKISVDVLDGEFRIRTSNGSIHMINSKGPGIAETSNGKINFIASQAVGNLSLITSNGSINADLTELTGDKYLFRTSNSHVTIRISEGAGFTLNGKTSNGEITTDYILQEDGKTIFGTVNGGGPSIDIQTSNGNITLQKK